MNARLWILMLLLLGLTTGKVVGPVTAFTRGAPLYDLLAGGLGALIGGGLLRWIGPLGLRGSAAGISRWLGRRVSRDVAHPNRHLAGGAALAAPK